MGDVLGVVPRTYYGLDVDKTNQVGLTGERYQATDTGITYKWDQTRWRGGYEYVERRTAAWDKTLVDFTIDGTWKVNGLDLSGIVPVGAKAVILKLNLLDDAATTNFVIRTSAVAAVNSLTLTMQVANIGMDVTAILPIDADRLFDYVGTNVVFTGINLVVVGWYI